MALQIETAEIEALYLSDEWRKLKSAKIAAIEFNPIDRPYLLEIVAVSCLGKTIYYWNSGYSYFQKLVKNQLVDTDFKVNGRPLEVIERIIEPAIFILEGLGQVDRNLKFRLQNFYFKPQQHQKQIVVADSYLDIPIDLFAIVQTLRIGVPKIKQIELILKSRGIDDREGLASACFGLYRGEIELLIHNYPSSIFFSLEELKELKSTILKFKTQKLAEQGLEIAPEPDIDAVGGLDLIEEDLEMIKSMNTPEARKRGLSLPKACLLLGLPGTGKSLISKLMGKKLGAVLVSCNWNQLLDGNNLARSLSNLQKILDLVDNIGGICILFFDEFEKAYSGWDTGSNGGVLSKMAGTLLTWMQDHTSPVIMLATINHLEMLPPELIRRFEYRWFFDSDLHNGAMQEIFLLHINKHFPDLIGSLNKSQWFTIFSSYYGCSPDEIAKAVNKTHQRLFFIGQAENVDPETLKNALVYESTQFTPAIENSKISDALFKIRREKGFARPVRGEDKSEFAVSAKGLFEFDEKALDLKQEQIKTDFASKILELFRKLLDSEPDKQYSLIRL